MFYFDAASRTYRLEDSQSVMFTPPDFVVLLIIAALMDE